MAIRREVVLIIILLVIIAALAMVVQFFKMDIEEADASNFVTEDLMSKYPDADIEIMTITEMYNDMGQKYFEVKAKVTESPDTPCPKRSHIYYNYPAQNFVPQPPDVITKNCVVCTEGICTIAFPEEAIIASHTFQGTEDVAVYLQDYQNALPVAIENEESWKVVWDSQTADSYYVVQMHRDGTDVEVESFKKS